MPANLEKSAVATGLEKVSFHSNPKERQCQRRLKLPHNCTHLTYFWSNAQILQARLQQYVNCELPDVQAGFRKGRGTKDQIANIHWIMEKAREFQKNLYFCFIDYSKAFVFSSVQLLSPVHLFVTPWITARQPSLSITNSQSSLKLMSIESVMPYSHLILCRPLFLLSPIPPSIRVTIYSLDVLLFLFETSLLFHSNCSNCCFLTCI